MGADVRLVISSDANGFNTLRHVQLLGTSCVCCRSQTVPLRLQPSQQRQCHRLRKLFRVGNLLDGEICMIIGRNHRTILIKFPFINLPGSAPIGGAQKILSPLIDELITKSSPFVSNFYHYFNCLPKDVRSSSSYSFLIDFKLLRISQVKITVMQIHARFMAPHRNTSINNTKSINIQYWKSLCALALFLLRDDCQSRFFHLLGIAK